MDKRKKSFQDFYPDNMAHCYGCGRLNEFGHQIKSYWDGDDTVCHFKPKSHHIAIPGFVYGGLIASLVDCHGTGTAAAVAYKTEGRDMDSLPSLRFLTASLHVDYLKPTPLDEELEIRGMVDEVKGRKVTVSVSVAAKGLVTAKGKVIAVQVPEDLISNLIG
ncbi:PaaI family thioesterase [Chloroflexota bacterium]